MKNKKILFHDDMPLDDDEKEIEQAINFEKAERPKDVKTRIATLKAAASHYLRKDKQINIRISSSDLLRLKEAAAEDGLPYQTLIASILHKYAVGHTVHRS
ncbi:MAG: hypothetical protein A3J38_02815 [Gammaproteobacteria bacterium RIFCSPHIGHO2_12_FULL_45_9]|nr:MAG: hypothetical protein A3J38_02815 [Gammaproteobacteria bacterium RIFCSPHIGHO2_12_FULL_45_9]